MKKLIALILITLPLSFGPSLLSGAAEETVTGELLKIEGKVYVVKDAAGKEVRVRVDKSTKLEGTFKPGDPIEVKMSGGKALAVKRGGCPAGPPC